MAVLRVVVLRPPGELYNVSIMIETCTHKMIISSDTVDGLNEDERKLVAFNFIQSLARIVGGRAVHRAIVVYLDLNGYDVHKL